MTRPKTTSCAVCAVVSWKLPMRGATIATAMAQATTTAIVRPLPPAGLPPVVGGVFGAASFIAGKAAGMIDRTGRVRLESGLLPSTRIYPQRGFGFILESGRERTDDRGSP